MVISLCCPRFYRTSCSLGPPTCIKDKLMCYIWILTHWLEFSFFPQGLRIKASLGHTQHCEDKYYYVIFNQKVFLLSDFQSWSVAQLLPTLEFSCFYFLVWIIIRTLLVLLKTSKKQVTLSVFGF